MKICMFVHNPIINDGRVKREAKYLASVGHEVTVIGTPAPGLPEREEWSDVTFLRIEPKGGLSPLLAKRLRWRKRMAGVLRLFPGRRRTQERLPADREREPTAARARGFCPVPPPQSGLRAIASWWRVCLEARMCAWPWVVAGRALKADVYHAHDMNTLVTAFLCARAQHSKLVYDSHELWVEWGQNKGGDPAHVVQRAVNTESRLAKAADLVITVSDGLADELRRLCGIERPLVVRNCAQLVPVTRSRTIGEIIGTPPSRPVLLYQGGFASGRALRELVIAAQVVPSADFVLLGPDSRYKDELKQMARTSGCRNVHFLPAVPNDDLWRYTCSANAGFVLTKPDCLSYSLSLSNKVFEYMAAGIPIVASAIENHRRLAAETGALLLVDPYDPADIARGVGELLASPERMRQMGLLAREWAERKYNASHEMEKLVTAYERMMRGTTAES